MEQPQSVKKTELNFEKAVCKVMLYMGDYINEHKPELIETYIEAMIFAAEKLDQEYKT